MRVVPDLIGFTLPEARSRLEREGLQAAITIVEARNENDAERIATQSVAAGRSVEAGTTIRLGLAGPWVAANRPAADAPGSAIDPATAESDWGPGCPAILAGQSLTMKKGPRMYAGTNNERHSILCKYGEQTWITLTWKAPGDPTSDTFDQHQSYIAGYASGNVFYWSETGLPESSAKMSATVISLSHLADCLVTGHEQNLGMVIEGAQRLLKEVEGFSVRRSRPADLRGAVPCPRGTREVGGTLGQETTRCVRQ
jgi:hypothetical protein